MSTALGATKNQTVEKTLAELIQRELVRSNTSHAILCILKLRS